MKEISMINMCMKSMHIENRGVNEEGFTLIELLITLTLLAILVALGGPSFTTQVHSSRVKTTALNLLEAVQLTRTQAVTSNSRSILKAREQWQNGWDIFIDSNSNGLREENETLIVSREPVESVRITANQPVKRYVSYIGTGESRMEGTAGPGGFQAGTFTICPISPGAGYQLILARGGRMRMQEIDAEQCAAH